MAPAVACAALALEFYFKSLILLEGKAPEQTHNLRTLFDRVSEPRRDLIRQYADDCAIRDRVHQTAMRVAGQTLKDTTFDTLLDVSAEAFDIYRYAFEMTSNGPFGFLARHVSLAVRKLILEIEPEWSASG
jgi:hypothetical protein